MMILKRDNVERIVKDEITARSLLSDGWHEIATGSESKDQEDVEKPKRSRKKSEGAN